MSHHRKTVTAIGAPAAIGPYSHGVVAGGLLFCSGQIPLDPATGELVDGDDRRRRRAAAWRTSRAVCAAAGAELADAVRCTVYLDRHGRLRRGQRGLRRVLRRPTRRRASPIGVAALPQGAQVEIDAIVALPD